MFLVNIVVQCQFFCHNLRKITPAWFLHVDNQQSRRETITSTLILTVFCPINPSVGQVMKPLICVLPPQPRPQCFTHLAPPHLCVLTFQFDPSFLSPSVYLHNSDLPFPTSEALPLVRVPFHPHLQTHAQIIELISLHVLNFLPIRRYPDPTLTRPPLNFIHGITPQPTNIIL